MTFNPKIVKELTVQELKTKLDSNQSIELIDVREKNEFDMVNIGGKLIPKGEVLKRYQEIDSKKETIAVLCRSGKRSEDIVLALQKEFGWENLYNVVGGILEWAEKIDPSLPRY
ncbi:MAG: rhodanese-like domain-containing protein [Leptospiraceae bacterium]|nr:rhodanese-like domain-containing protein [Leptospiraceae bacterium]MCP5512885.1 rhodanese-like domain-containing protein [Leptospiraceae bacterium]